jgi:hypothetical protein
MFIAINKKKEKKGGVHLIMTNKKKEYGSARSAYKMKGWFLSQWQNGFTNVKAR